jgi:hypothetical protein
MLYLKGKDSTKSSVVAVEGPGQWVGYMAANGSSSSAWSGIPSGAFGLTVAAPIPMVFATDSTERARIDSSGYFYVNTTTNFNSNSIANFQAKASQQGPTFASQTSGNYSAICWNSGTATTSLLAFQSGSGQTGVGSITYNGSLVLYNTTSDQRLKENIIHAPSALSKINSIQIRSFDWIETGNHIDFGVIAQELEQIAPEAVTQGEDKEDGSIKRAWAVDTSVLVPAMIKAIQEQQALIESLTTRLTALENK